MRHYGEEIDVQTGKISSETKTDTSKIPAVGTVEKEENEKKKVADLQLTSYKAGKKTLSGKTVKNAKVTVKIASKTYTTKADAKGKFSVALKKKLAHKDKIKITVKKSGYQTLKKTFTVK
ncbi:hypothetical protein D7V86_05585 [bacterium D16-51]|nr:hypothetical protein D7V96_21065 [bacterium D16-59]RKI61534.1 hypothetical protein D7V86_05585 [bacterium D16-51]